MPRVSRFRTVMALLPFFTLLSCGGGGSGTKKSNQPPTIDPIPPQQIQAGQLLTLNITVTDDGAIPPVVSGTIQGPLLTGGLPTPLQQTEGVEFDDVAGRLVLRIPPREAGPLEIVFRAVDGSNPALESQAIVPVTVDPPNLYDGVLLDGIFDPFEANLIAGASQRTLATIQMYDLTTYLPAGTIAASYEVATDARHIYLVVSWDDTTEDRSFDLNVDPGPQEVDTVQLSLDQDDDGLYEDGEDRKLCFTYLTGSGYIDQHEESNPAFSADDPTVNGAGRMDYDPGTSTYTAELLIPRSPDSDSLDADFTTGRPVPFNLLFYDGLGPAGLTPLGGGLSDITLPDATTWADFPQPAPLPATYAPVATPTQGSLICISNHEDPNGEIYEVDLATGSLVRLTFNTRYEDWVSVSPDGSYAAYGSAPTQTDYNNYEIYKWERSTGLETALTANSVLDGHPGISPDNQQIVFVTFNFTGTADIFIMDRDGGGVVRITNNSIEENDPEWTKDGRLAIKSTEWTGREQMGVMDASGVNPPIQLTNHSYSDHDGMVSPDNRWILYERFEDSIPWSQDANLTNSTPWTIRMVSVDGTEERLLVDNPLVNWLPVMGPEEVTAYFRSTAFNGIEVRMIDSFGTDLGRLVPDQSQIRYIDWK
ncbi:MAG: hypothetical protein O7H41_10055 [Planctomycetota bacterium]|nr:hypothetical protein [Planctomycetota bacterium]